VAEKIHSVYVFPRPVAEKIHSVYPTRVVGGEIRDKR
jgi:hypothetical protein